MKQMREFTYNLGIAAVARETIKSTNLWWFT